MLLSLTRYLAKQLSGHSLAFSARYLWYLSRNAANQVRLFKILALPEFADAAGANPNLLYKYVAGRYLSKGLSMAERASCQAHHYGFLRARLGSSLFREILRSKVTIFEARRGESIYSITIKLSEPMFREGEINMDFCVDGDAVFNLSFTVVPGTVVGSEAADALLISRIQGVKGRRAELCLAAKAFYDISPVALLVAALQGFGQAFGIRALAVVSAKNQCSYSEKNSFSFKKAYDDFMVSIGIPMGKAGFYLSPIPIQEKPLALVKSNNRLRTKLRRSFKRQVAEEVCSLLC
jgi:uncharacterized protein VirK/YbjX